MSQNVSSNCTLYLQLLLSLNITENNVPFECVRYSKVFELFLIVVFFVLFIGTVGGNFLVIASVALVKKLQTPSNFLIVNLACSDFLVSILVFPGAVYQQINRNRWPFSKLLCDIFIGFDVLLCTSSILNLCAISIDRYLVITRPLQYASKRTPTRMGTMVAISWASSALISITPAIVLREKFVDGQCNYSENLVYQIYATFGAFYIPLLVMLVLYGRIFKLAREISVADGKVSFTYTSDKLVKEADSQLTNCPMEMSFEKRSVTSISKDKPNSHLEQGALYRKSRSKSHTDSKAITTLGVIMGCFTICWLPFFIIQIVKSVLKMANIDYMLYLPVWLIELCLWLGYVNSFLNPIIYVKFNREFRTPFRQILMCRCTSINARLRSETFVQEYGLSNVTGKYSYCGRRLSCDQSSINNSIQSCNRRRRPQVSRSNVSSNGHQRSTLQQIKQAPVHVPSVEDSHRDSLISHPTPAVTPIISDQTSVDSPSYNFLFSGHNIPCCSKYDQRCEKCVYHFGPASETASIDPPPHINVSIEDLTIL